MELVKFNPTEEETCNACHGPKEGQYRDMVGIGMGHRLVLCNSCALELVRILLDRFYPVWGDGPLYDRAKRAITDWEGADPMLVALREIASGSCCETPGCSISDPMCDAMTARAAITGVCEE